MALKFSVGKIMVGSETIAKCTGITVRVDGAPVDFYGGGYPLPKAIELGNRSVTISVDYGDFGTIDPNTILTNSYVDIVLQASDYDANRGIDGITLTDCKATSYEIASTQDGFITYRLEFRKADLS